MASLFPCNGVLLGVAEVRLPLKHLSDKELVHVTQICYQQLLCLDVTKATPEEQNLRCFGVIDSFYALQEVSIRIQDDICCLIRKEEAILEWNCSDLIMATTAQDCMHRLIIMSYTRNFGKTAVIMQMHSQEITQKVINHLYSLINRDHNEDIKTPNISRHRKGGESFGKTVGRKVEKLFKNITFNGDATPVLKIIRTSIALMSDDEEDSHSDENTEPEKQNSSVDEVIQRTHSFHKSSVSALEAEFEYLKNSEKSYIASLQYIQEVKLKLEQSYSYNLLNELKFYQVFHQIENLLETHTDFMIALQQCVTITDVISVFENFSTKFEIYVHYISKILTIDSALRSNSEFFKESGPQLGENLRKPRMRLNYYVLALESLQKRSSAEENKKLQKEIDKLKFYLKRSNTKLVIETVYNSSIDLSKCGEFVTGSELTVKKGGHFQHKKYQVLLFETVMVFARGNLDKCEYKDHIRLQDIEVLHEMRGVLIHLRVKQKGCYSRLIFKSKTIKLQQNWIQFLKNQTKNLSKEESHNKYNSDINQTCTELTSTHNLPPLTLIAAYPCFYTQISPEVRLEQCNLHLLESGQTVIECLGKLLRPDLLSQKDFMGLRNDLEKIYLMHTDQLMPSMLSFLKNSKEKPPDTQQVVDILRLSQPLYEKLLYMAAVFKYEFTDNLLSSCLEQICHNFILFSKLIQRWKVRNLIWREIEQLIGESVNNVSILLKKKYVRSCQTNLCIQSFCEGFLTITDSEVGHNCNLVYVILTRNHLTILNIVKDYFQFSHSVATDMLRLLNDSFSHNKFQIQVIDAQKEHIYYFSTETTKEKEVWINTLDTISKYY